MAGAISVGIALGVGVPFGLLSGYRGGFIDALISRITDAMLACPFLILAIALAAFLGPEPRQRHDRDRHHHHADIRAADARPDHERQGRGLCRGRARHGQSALAHRAVSHPAEHHAGAAGAGDAVDRRRHHRRSRAVVPRPRPATAGAVLGQHAERRATLSRPTRRGWRFGRGWRSSWWCCRSTWSATACATRSIRGSGVASPLPPGERCRPHSQHPARTTSQITVSRITRRQSISYSRSTTGGRAKCQVRPERAAPWRTSSSTITG